jgi:hypothetical protein
MADRTGHIEDVYSTEMKGQIEEGKFHKISNTRVRKFQEQTFIISTLTTVITNIDNIEDTINHPEEDQEFVHVSLVEIISTNDCTFCKHALSATTTDATIKCQIVQRK